MPDAKLSSELPFFLKNKVPILDFLILNRVMVLRTATFTSPKMTQVTPHTHPTLAKNLDFVCIIQFHYEVYADQLFKIFPMHQRLFLFNSLIIPLH